MNRRVFDCFTFFNELELLDLRLCELYDTVDYFVLCESTLTFTGKPKPLYFNENKPRFHPYLNKIIHVVVDDFPETNDPWVREYFQREAIRRGLGFAEEEDLVIITDVDEILNPAAVMQAKHFDGHIQFNMNIYQYYMNLLGGRNDWTAPFGFTWKNRDKIPDLSRARWVKDEVEAAFPIQFHRLDDAGWHFTHLGGVDRLHQKFQSYSHVNDPWPQAMMNKGALEKQIVSGGAVGETKSLSEFMPIDSSYPKTVINRQTYYRQIGFIKDIYEAFKELQSEYHGLRKSYAVQAYGDGCKHAALGGITGEDYLNLSGIENPFEGKVVSLPKPNGELLSQGKKATQSSLCEWSCGETIELDASGALDGTITGFGKFHTEYENEPWWMVDLESINRIREIRVFNRLVPFHTEDNIAGRSARLKIEAGGSLDNMKEIFRKDDDISFGGIDGKPLIVVINGTLIARFMRITLLTTNYLHFDQVEIYGEAF